jgi:hypothetical protein
MVWGRDERVQRFARVLCDSIGRRFGWPNDYFIPADPCKLLFYGDEGESAEILLDIEEWFGISEGTIGVRSLNEIYEIYEMNLGQAVSYLLKDFGSPPT